MALFLDTLNRNVMVNPSTDLSGSSFFGSLKDLPYLEKESLIFEG